MEKLVILGNGPAGLTAAIYASRANLAPVVYAGPQPGGLLTMTSEIENFPGFPDGVDGFNLMDYMRQQAINVGADVRNGIITSIDLGKRPFIAKVDDGKTIEAETVIVAVPASFIRFSLPEITTVASGSYVV